MSKSPVETYFEYAENVLGIKQIVIDRTVSIEADSNHNEPEQVQILISVENLESYNEVENELLYKMIQALQIKPETYLVVDRSLRTNYIAANELTFVDVPEASTVDVIQTYSARVLVQKPALKKHAWTEMQKLLQKI